MARGSTPPVSASTGSRWTKRISTRLPAALAASTGTGNFIVHLMQRLTKRDLPRMYREQLFANEVMLMPYYIAALNIEHAYMELGAAAGFRGVVPDYN